MNKVTKYLGIGCLSLCALCSGFMLTGCGGKAKAATTKQTFAFAAASSASLLTGGGMRMAGMSGQLAAPTTADNTAEIDMFKKYLSVFEGVLANGGLYKIKEEKNTDPAYPDFDQKITTTKKDLLGKTETSIMLFKETAIKAEESDKDIDEVESELIGVLINGESIYDIKGKKEVETGELEIELEATLKSDPTKKVMFKQEIEGTEQEYEYSIYNGTTLVDQTAFEIETENNETEIEFLAKKGAETNFYELTKKAEGNKEYIEIKHKANADDNSAVIKNIKVEITTDAAGNKAYNFNYVG